MIVLFTWSKDPSSVFSFENLVFEDARGQLDFRPHWYFFASVGLFTSAYALLLPAAGFVGLNVWPLTVSHGPAGGGLCVCVRIDLLDYVTSCILRYGYGVCMRERRCQRHDSFPPPPSVPFFPSFALSSGWWEAQ